MRLSVEPVTVDLRAPFAAGHGTVDTRELLLVGLEAGDGRTGYGEAAPLPSYDGVSIDDVLGALEACRPVLDTYPGHAPIADVIARCAEVTVIAPALAAIDLALWDLAGQWAGQPVWRLLGASTAPPVIVNRTIAAADRSTAAREAAEARAAGFRTVKVKVGIGDDPGRLAAVRAFAGPAMGIRIDANGAWALEEALAMLDVLEPVGIELCEEPVHGLEPIAALRGETAIPLALDESAELPGALDAQVCELACLKISRCGGITRTVEADLRARTTGYDTYLASTLDGPLGIAAALHAAAVIGPMRACGLATLGLFADHDDPLPARDGAIAIPTAPGLSQGLLDWYHPTR